MSTPELHNAAATPSVPKPSPGSMQATRVLPVNDSVNAYVRKHCRAPLDIEIMIHEIDEFGNVRPGSPARCADISQGGFGVRCKKVMYAGHRAAIVIGGKPGHTKVLFGTVANICYVESGRYHIGFMLDPTPESPSIINWLRQIGANVQAKAA